MKKPDSGWKRAGRVVAGAQILFNLGTAPKPPEMTPPAREQTLQSQWAKNQTFNVTVNNRVRARELGYALREPESAEHRPPEDARSRGEVAGHARDTGRGDAGRGDAGGRGAAGRGDAGAGGRGGRD